MLGFYVLKGEPPEMELSRMMVEPDAIGTGCGPRQLAIRANFPEEYEQSARPTISDDWAARRAYPPIWLMPRLRTFWPSAK